MFMPLFKNVDHVLKKCSSAIEICFICVCKNVKHVFKKCSICIWRYFAFTGKCLMCIDRYVNVSINVSKMKNRIAKWKYLGHWKKCSLHLKMNNELKKMNKETKAKMI